MYSRSTSLVLLALIGCCPESPPRQKPIGPPTDGFECPQGTELMERPWGGIGMDVWARFCVVKQGPYRNYMHGAKFTEGQYVDGMQEGVWLAYDQDGSVVYSEVFDGGSRVAAFDGGPCGGMAGDAGTE